MVPVVSDQHFYPEIEPYDHGDLEVDAPHVLHWEQCGNPDGEPIVFLHGGPGAGATAEATANRHFVRVCELGCAAPRAIDREPARRPWFESDSRRRKV